ncbi:phosphoenolpyruvate carboxylase [Anopheles sinensis]|uniref:Phosphoenolpyruvate carboxylase n=1 Tax=Anopheles sinensis TaxID=74873 RepID=A0A084W8L9_ANOSI|nr:phosphoenolpyruvate carboxylase [Anopheles sinensis]
MVSTAALYQRSGEEGHERETGALHEAYKFDAVDAGVDKVANHFEGALSPGGGGVEVMLPLSWVANRTGRDRLMWCTHPSRVPVETGGDLGRARGDERCERTTGDNYTFVRYVTLRRHRSGGLLLVADACGNATELRSNWKL